MTHMIDNQGVEWSVGDLVWDRERREQGIIEEILSQRCIYVRYVGHVDLRFVSGLTLIKRQEGE